MPRKKLLKRPQVNIVLSEPQLADIQSIMEERGILHLSDYVRQLAARDIRQWKVEQYENFTNAKEQNTLEYQEFLKWKQGEKAGA